MIVASDADEAWWPPTFKPSSLGRRWLALWIIHDASQSTLRSSSDKNFRRSALDIFAFLLARTRTLPALGTLRKRP
jgi:hypothetical protein